MFPINGSFYIPMFYYNPQSILLSNPQILYPNMNNFSINKTYSNSNIIYNPCAPIEREIQKELDNSELYIPVKNQNKSRHLMKKKCIKKKFQKIVDSIAETEKLRRKLANRPKTYKTQKKMYLKTDLTAMGIEDEGKRILRKRTQPKRKHNILEQASLKCKIDEKQEELIYEEYSEKEKIENMINNKKNKLEQNLSFYDSQALLPKHIQFNKWSKEMEHKRINLLCRQFEKNIFSLQ